MGSPEVCRKVILAIWPSLSVGLTTSGKGLLSIRPSPSQLLRRMRDVSKFIEEVGWRFGAVKVTFNDSFGLFE